MLGLGRSRLTRVPVDSQGRMRADELPRLTAPSILCVQAGNVNSGAFDPFEALCAAARDAGAWVHVDGAFGLWARASGALSHLARGLELADSWATDAHKWLNVPYDSGIAFVRDAPALQSAMAITAEYLPGQGERRNPADFTPELSRRARGVEVWAALCEPGTRRTGGDDRAKLRAGPALRRGAQESGIRGAERCRAESGRGVASAIRNEPDASSRPFSGKEPAGQASPSGKATRPCASVSRRGRPATTTSIAASRRWWRCARECS